MIEVSERDIKNWLKKPCTQEYVSFILDICDVYNKHNLCIEMEEGESQFDIVPLNEGAVKFLCQAYDYTG